MSSVEEKESKKGIWQKVIVLLPIWFCCLLAELVAFGAWVGPYPRMWKILLVCLIPHLMIAVLGMIPIVNRWIAEIERRIIEWCCGLKQRQWHWKKSILVLLADCGLGLLIERILTWASEDSLTAEWNARKWIWAATIVFLISLFVCYRQLLIEKIEVIVLLVILSIGTVYVTTLPVSCGISWDDEAHFHNSLMMSHILDGRMTTADADILNGFVDTALEHNIYEKEAHQEWVQQLNADQATGIWGQDARIRPTIQNWVYIPAAVGLAVGRALHLPYHMTFVLGKWCNLLVYAVLVYWSIRKLKSGKMIAAVVSLLPPCILMAASYARDPWMIGFIMLGFSWFIGEIQDTGKKLKIWDMVVMLGAFVLGVAPKAVYVPLVLICFFMPKEKFQSEKQCRRFRLVMLGATLLLLATFAVPFIMSSGGAVEDTRGGSEVNAAAQTAYILQNPFRYLGVLFSFLGEYASLEAGRTYLTYLHYFGTADYALVIEVLLFVVAFTDRSEVDCRVKWQPKIATLVMSFGAICLAATAMYIAYTPYKADTILGCQYRYMLQIMFPVLYVIGSIPVENRMRKDWYRGIILGISAFVLLNGVWDLCIRAF